MSRRLEVTVPNSWAEPVRECLDLKCQLNKTSGKPHMVTEVNGPINTIFFVTVPGSAISSILTELRLCGIGIFCGRITLFNLDYLKPDLSKPLDDIVEFEREQRKKEKEHADANKALVAAGKPKRKDFAFKKAQFLNARKTTEEMYAEISGNTSMTINTWFNLIGACMMAAGGLVTNVTVFIVAAMLVSPIMGPILGMTFGYRIGDWLLFKKGFKNEVKMAFAAWAVGAMFGTVMGRIGNTYNWPNSAMMPEGGEFNLVMSLVVSSAAGTVLGVALTSNFGTSMVGTAISAGLLPPIINAGMMMAYSQLYASPEQRTPFYNTGVYNLLFYLTHVISIVVVANFIFYLKNIDEKFKDKDDVKLENIPSLKAHREKLLSQGISENDVNAMEKEKLKNFTENIKDDLKDGFFQATGMFASVTNTLTGGLIDLRDVKYFTKDVDKKVRSETSVNEAMFEVDHDSIHDGKALKKADKDDMEGNPKKNGFGKSSAAGGNVKSSTGGGAKQKKIEISNSGIGSSSDTKPMTTSSSSSNSDSNSNSNSNSAGTSSAIAAYSAIPSSLSSIREEETALNNDNSDGLNNSLAVNPLHSD